MKLTIENELQQGIAAHKEGKLQDAERLYRAILKSQPLHPHANRNMGILAVLVKKVCINFSVRTSTKILRALKNYVNTY